jgi:hypothetical protein
MKKHVSGCLTKKNMFSQDNHLSSGGGCSGGQSATFRIESDGSSPYIDADNQVSEEMHLIFVVQKRRRQFQKLINKNLLLVYPEPNKFRDYIER